MNRDAHRILAAVMQAKNPLSLMQQAVQLRQERPQLHPLDAVMALAPPDLAEAGARFADQLRRDGVGFVTLADNAYPLLLREIPDPPALLFYRGDLSILSRPCVAVVGSRKVTTYGLQTTRMICERLAGMGFTIVSGLALGVDRRAHDTALEAGGATAAVFGCGVDHAYPREHAPLIDTLLAANNCILSEFRPGTPPRPYHFPVRNRIISGLSRAVLVMEGHAKSGSLITARTALDQGRDLYALPGSIHEENAQGPLMLIHRGEAQIITSVDKLVADLAPMTGLRNPSPQAAEGLVIQDETARAIYGVMDPFEPIMIDELAEKTGFAAPKVAAALIALEDLDAVEAQPGGLYLRHTRPLK